MPSQPGKSGSPERLCNQQKVTDRQWLLKLLQKYNQNSGGGGPNDPASSLPTIIQNKALVVAPMVEQSDLPFRLLCRRYGANLAFTPMIHSGWLTRKQAYRDKMLPSGGLEDRPLIAQICGTNKHTLLQAAQLLESHGVDAIDLNCGCPTKTAKRGGYGAYLLQSGAFLVDIVRHLADHLSVPLTVKVRLLPGGLDESLELYEKLVDAGAAMLTIHGRTKSATGPDIGRADWEAIRRVVERLGSRIPILSNGNIGGLDDVCRCLEVTGADGVMSSEAILEYPPLFSPLQEKIGRLRLAREYLDLCQRYPPEKGGGGTGMQCITMHIDTFLHADWKEHRPDWRTIVRSAHHLDELYDIINRLELIHNMNGLCVNEEQLRWYTRHRD